MTPAPWVASSNAITAERLKASQGRSLDRCHHSGAESRFATQGVLAAPRAKVAEFVRAIRTSIGKTPDFYYREFVDADASSHQNGDLRACLMVETEHDSIA